MIRFYSDQDITQVLEIFSRNCPDFFDLSETGELVDYLKIHGETYFVFENGGAITAACGYHWERETSGRISWIFTDPGNGSKGLGTALVSHCVEELKSCGAKQVSVWTSDKAFHFFEKLGFTIVRTEPAFWAGRFDLFVMQKGL